MKITFTTEQLRRKELICFLERYLSKKNIYKKGQFIKYKNILLRGEKLTHKYLCNLIRFLQWDIQKSEKEIYLYFSCLVTRDEVPETPSGTLEPFFQQQRSFK